jgi:Holliday junction resolvasome RuvABC endonuclease subunit
LQAEDLYRENNPLKNVPISPVKKNGYRILALDQASITSGYAIFDNEKLVTYGKWSSNGNHSTERITQTKAWVACMIDRWKPDLVVLEDIQLQKFGTINGQENEGVITFKKLAALQGVLKNYCFETGIVYKIVPPATWRAHSEIKGRQRTDIKKNAQLKVKKLYDISVTQDEADAILIGAWAVYDHNQSKIIMFE